MDSEKIVEIQQQLVDIGGSVASLMHCTKWMERSNIDLSENLQHVWDITQELQRKTAHSAIVHGLCCEALDQVARVSDLITECEGVPDAQQLASIGIAGELMAEKIKLYQEMSRHAAHVKAMEEAGVKEPA
ncbi:MAG: hypothetical protein PHI97_27400 [Desulfobulbus sp.]|nr:hypothetical protein [Desulfobulbus sp.]